LILLILVDSGHNLRCYGWSGCA